MDQRSKYFIHDKLVQKIYSDPREAISLLQAGLPEDLVNKIDWKSLRYHKKSNSKQLRTCYKKGLTGK